MQLDSARTFGFSSPDPLQLSQMLALFDLHGVNDSDERLLLVRYITRLDSAWLMRWFEERKARSVNSGSRN